MGVGPGEDRTEEGAEGEIDVRGLAHAVFARRKLVAGIVLAVVVAAVLFVTMVRPRYTAEAKLLVENQESYLARPDRNGGDPAAPDAEAVTSQVQVVTSRDLARTAIQRLGLRGNPEFDPAAAAPSIFGIVSGLLGGRRGDGGDERVIDAYFERLAVSQVAKSRVLQIEFRSNNPDLAARAANTVADLYIELQSDAKRKSASTAAVTLGALVADLRTRVAQAESAAEEFRASHGIVLGANNLSMSSQQLSDISNQLTLARSAQADAQAKAQLIREMIKQGKLAEVSEVANNDLVKRISEQRVNVRSQIAAESRTLLAEHPRIKELTAQLAGLEGDLRSAADRAAKALETDARLAGAKVENLQAVLEQQRKSLGGSSVDEARARELDRTARLLKEQLESSVSRYQDALARQNAESTPGDARVISRAVPPSDPSFPKKLPIIIFAGIAAFVLSSGGIVVSILLAGGGIIARAPASRPEVPGDVAVVRPVSAVSPREPSASREDRFPSDTTLPDAPILSGAVTGLLGRIAGSVRAGRALRILVTAGGPDVEAAETALTLGQALAREGSTIFVDLTGASTSGPGLQDILGGRATFDEAIQLEAGTRLHRLGGGAQGIQAGPGLDLVVEALAQTYSYVILLVPMLQKGGIAESLATVADLAVLACSSRAADPSVSQAFQMLREAGAREILAIAVDPDTAPPRRDVA